jgi:prepilin peptidase CpaA
MSPWLLSIVSVTVALVAAVTDLRSGRIPNWLTFSAALVGLAGHSFAQGVAGATASFVGIAICAAVPGIVYRSSQGRGIGGGDIKLLAALGALLGPSQGLEVELSAFLLLGVYALFRLAFIGQLGRTLLGSLRVTAGLFIPKLRHGSAEDEALMTTMRMGPAIALAVATVLSLPHLMRWLPWLG